MDASQAEQQIALIQAVAKRDRLAFEQLYRLTSPHLFAVALRMLRQRAWAEEILHECYITVWHNAASFNSALSSPLTWMTHIVRNRCIDWLRSGYARQFNTDETWIDDLSSTPGDVSLDEQCDPQVARLHHCLQHLSSEQRQSIALAYYQGLSHSDIAGWLQQPVGSVKSWIRRGLDHLRECVGR
ncbi:sigma-70 family RNA polymerase sigma factor [Pantoea sp. Cy-640]|uniref:sigma-70 family RNA polymerase sigma factor n=1 Tax=Pantoea sp. Cy-640 TaxID=2608353 RepID=UPI0014194A78|nr:sigma-70 family RNA polymerase sigma factor [Pantoea sp. Cy-640]NIG12889.1 sigma-70 family RNA polymerase sigma factor [Pantoea sp. Cy-640]